MTEEVVKALIGAAVSITVAIVGVVGIWLGRKPLTDRRAQPTEDERRDDPVLIGLVKDLVSQQVRSYERRIGELEAAVDKLESQRAEREQRIEALEAENRELRETVERQEEQIADLQTQIELMQSREAKRDG